MMNKKTIPALTLALALIISLAAGPALAQNDDAKPAPPAKGKVMSPEDWEAFSALRDAHRQKMAPIHEELWAKGMEYEALKSNPNTKPAEVRALIDEMGKLRKQIRDSRDEFRTQAEAKGFGPGKGFRGHKGGFGPGGHGGPGYGCGFGPGYDDDGPGYGHRGPGNGRHHKGDWRGNND